MTLKEKISKTSSPTESEEWLDRCRWEGNSYNQGLQESISKAPFPLVPTRIDSPQLDSNGFPLQSSTTRIFVVVITAMLPSIPLRN